MQDGFYRELIQKSPIGWTYNRILCDSAGLPIDYEFLEVNPAFLKISGLQGAEVEGKRLSEVIPGLLEHDPHWLETVGSIALDGGSCEVENYFSALGKWYRIAIFSPEKYYFVTQLTDISQDYHNKGALLDSLGAAIYVADMQTNEILFVNGTGREVWGDIVGQICWKTLRRGFEGPCDYCTNPHLLDELGEPNGIHEWEYYEKDSKKWYRSYDSAVRWTGSAHMARLAMILDITQLKQAEDRSRESEERYHLLSNVAFEGVFIHNQGTVIDANESLARMLGVPFDELVGCDLVEFVHPADRHIVFESMKTSNSRPYEARAFRRDGTLFHAELQGRDFLLKGKPARVASMRDITERHFAQEALRASEHEHRQLIQQMRQGLALHQMMYDENGEPKDYRFLNANPSFERLTGLHLNEIIGKTVLEILPETERSWIYAYGKVAKTGESCMFEDYSREFGKHFEVTAYSPRKDQFAVIVADISERKVLEQALADEKNLLETTLISVGDAVVSTDIAGRIVFMNRVAQQLTGWDRNIAKGLLFETVCVLVDEYARERQIRVVHEVLEAGVTLDLSNHTLLVARDGTELPVENCAAPIVMEDGKIIGMVFVFRDCSEKRRKQEQIDHLSYHDQLTGLFNRRYFSRAMQVMDDRKFLPVSIVMADVDGLKLTNDAFGHRLGDQVLIELASLFMNEVRPEDVVARIGGDEFMLLLPNTDEESAKSMISRIEESLKIKSEDKPMFSVSFGLGVKSSMEFHLDDAYRQAEEQMCRHKLSQGASMRSRTIDIVMRTLYAKSEREEAHAKRVSALAGSIAEKHGYAKDMVTLIRAAGLLHDIGKIGVDEKILSKPGLLDEIEWQAMKRHPDIGFRILSSAPEFTEIAGYVLEHHERLNGKGYPRGLTAGEISVPARILALADSYDAMTSERPYKKCLSKLDAVQELKRHAGTQFDGEIARLFVEQVLVEAW